MRTGTFLSFAFQANKWLADVAPELLSATQRPPLANQATNPVESRISNSLYVQGWPVAMPTLKEARLIADTRSEDIIFTVDKTEYRLKLELRFRQLLPNNPAELFFTR